MTSGQGWVEVEESAAGILKVCTDSACKTQLWVQSWPDPDGCCESACEAVLWANALRNGQPRSCAVALHQQPGHAAPLHQVLEDGRPLNGRWYSFNGDEIPW